MGLEVVNFSMGMEKKPPFEENSLFLIPKYVE